jgi:hypothetical protein
LRIGGHHFLHKKDYSHRSKFEAIAAFRTDASMSPLLKFGEVTRKNLVAQVTEDSNLSLYFFF